jgi:hypothetical protein
MWIVALLAVIVAPLAARADFKQGDYELTLSGSAAHSPDLDGVTINVGGNLGYFITNEFEVGLRQSIGFTDIGTSGDVNGSTRVAVDYNFNLGQWVPYVGANLGYVYGDAVNDTWEAAPEAGVRYFVNNTTFIFASVEYQFFFNTGDDTSDSFSDGQFLYGLGIGFKF